ncbi:helix-turn-helix domain-containing protein [Hymenobacter rubripertinctus]|uniref:DNA-binding protein n=1 Tax=Hymenobacter rubripertinctus TaxID=2029981 RepID=A0A418R2Z9_9BACT|nr:helix-turn-helix domain-containing protein [Hymenobacter rubripertinctus]RIY11769.1 DNA-binding protein [Hymenobacter rubripertinctus]
MQVALLVPEQEWQQLLADVQRLKATESATKPAPPPPDRLLTVRQAAAHLNISPEGVRKARRAGRLSGLRLNEKEWGFRESELNRHLNRYNRPLPALARAA